MGLYPSLAVDFCLFSTPYKADFEFNINTILLLLQLIPRRRPLALSIPCPVTPLSPRLVMLLSVLVWLPSLFPRRSTSSTKKPLSLLPLVVSPVLCSSTSRSLTTAWPMSISTYVCASYSTTSCFLC